METPNRPDSPSFDYASIVCSTDLRKLGVGRGSDVAKLAGLLVIRKVIAEITHRELSLLEVGTVRTEELGFDSDRAVMSRAEFFGEDDIASIKKALSRLNDSAQAYLHTEAIHPLASLLERLPPRARTSIDLAAALLGSFPSAFEGNHYGDTSRIVREAVHTNLSGLTGLYLVRQGESAVRFETVEWPAIGRRRTGNIFRSAGPALEPFFRYGASRHQLDAEGFFTHIDSDESAEHIWGKGSRLVAA